MIILFIYLFILPLPLDLLRLPTHLLPKELLQEEPKVRHVTRTGQFRVWEKSRKLRGTGEQIGAGTKFASRQN